ncbi:hypothetical protein LOTGIDRAFT_165708 [Lottia gigantea]|uniref:TIR domain-containing protein n=1 Tax=Lottia gigantea TaxID=225164 RepID=V4A021_LOTGI|nr:hypothetical protein LOTGIDRAFT_165708 [Lottia gigantea]ESO88270.1 hypothetical protein LOTGIDRAFT_165708 [Lottia gigantea]
MWRRLDKNICYHVPLANGTIYYGVIEAGFNFDFSGNTPPPSNNNCAQITNYCILPTYCLHNGQCSFNTTLCETNCHCPSPYTGKRCREKLCPDGCGGNTTLCLNGGSCTINKDTCQQQCVCPEGYTGINCESNIQVTNDTETDQECPMNLCDSFAFCYKGICKQNKRTCAPYCICEDGFTGSQCETFIDSSDTTTASTPSIPSTSLAPLALRQCASGFTCKHGICDQEKLKENRFKCNCDKGFIGTTCRKPCRVDCGEYGHCYLDGLKERCACHPDWVGENCTDPKPTPATLIAPANAGWVWWVAGSCIGLLVLLVFLLIVLPVWLWKRREIFIMKIVHYMQPYEDSDGKMFDAFISYKSHPDDEGFVLNHVFQKLEKELGFKLCLHFRDFKVGETIANNILWAVENSRRTVLIISPNYLGSEYAQFEFQTAHLESLSLHSRIVPVIYKDISQHQGSIDATLKHILRTITYLEWPTIEDNKKETKFWKRLALSLPKRKELDAKSIEAKLSPSKDHSDNHINLLSYKTLNSKSTETMWTDVSLDETKDTGNYHKNLVSNSGDVSLNMTE